MRDGKGDKLSTAELEKVHAAVKSDTNRPSSAKGGSLPDRQATTPERSGGQEEMHKSSTRRLDSSTIGDPVEDEP
jgi:hypothetical protein